MCGASTLARPLPLTYNICLLLCVRPLPRLPALWEGFGETRRLSSGVGKALAWHQAPVFSSTVMSWKTLFFCSHSASSFATAVLPSKWRGVLQGKGDCRRKYAGTAYGSCCLRPSMVFPTLSTGPVLLPQPSVVSTNLKGTAWEPRRRRR